jgi:elongation factor G
VQPVLDAVCAYLPSPLDVPPVEGTDPRSGTVVTRPPSAEAPFAALVFKVSAQESADFFFLRVYSGRLQSGERALNPRTGERERLRRILRMHADRGEALDAIEAGQIVAVAGLHRSATGDTLCDEAAPVLLERIRFPDAVVAVAVEPRTAGDRDRFAEVLDRMQREDPTLLCSIEAETGQTLLSGMGELHLDVTIQRMQRDFGLEVHYGKPRVSYRETVTGSATGAAEYRRQIAGETLHARVEIGVEPLDRHGDPVEIVDRLRAGSVPASLLPGLAEAVRNAASGGGVFGYPVTGLRVTLLAARYDDVGQVEIALNSATSLAFRQALQAASPTVLEPYGRLEVRVAEEYLGGVVKSLHQRRALVEDTRFHHGAVVVRGVVPIGETFGYLTALRSQSQGRGTFALEPLDYRPVPANLVGLHHQRLYE